MNLTSCLRLKLFYEDTNKEVQTFGSITIYFIFLEYANRLSFHDNINNGNACLHKIRRRRNSLKAEKRTIFMVCDWSMPYFLVGPGKTINEILRRTYKQQQQQHERNHACFCFCSSSGSCISLASLMAFLMCDAQTNNALYNSCVRCVPVYVCVYVSRHGIFFLFCFHNI